MQVLLNSDVPKLGYRGDIVNVKAGYFRNFLMPKGVAQIANGAVRKLAESRKEKMVMKKQQLVDNAKDVLTKLKNAKLVLKAKLSEKGHLYASISESDIISALEKEYKVALEKDFIKMDTIKEAGEHEVLVQLGPDLKEKISVKVEAE